MAQPQALRQPLCMQPCELQPCEPITHPCQGSNVRHDTVEKPDEVDMQMKPELNHLQGKHE